MTTFSPKDQRVNSYPPFKSKSGITSRLQHRPTWPSPTPKWSKSSTQLINYPPRRGQAKVKMIAGNCPLSSSGTPPSSQPSLRMKWLWNHLGRKLRVICHCLRVEKPRRSRSTIHWTETSTKCCWTGLKTPSTVARKGKRRKRRNRDLSPLLLGLTVPYQLPKRKTSSSQLKRGSLKKS